MSSALCGTSGRADRLAPLRARLGAVSIWRRICEIGRDRRLCQRKTQSLDHGEVDHRRDARNLARGDSKIRSLHGSCGWGSVQTRIFPAS